MNKETYKYNMRMWRTREACQNNNWYSDAQDIAEEVSNKYQVDAPKVAAVASVLIPKK